MIAANAEPILSARIRGFKPDEMIMVSLGAKLNTANQVVYAWPEEAYDWRWVHGLDICVWIGDEPTWAPTVKAIAQCRPDYLCIWHQGQQWGSRVYLIPTAADVSKPVCMWQYELDFLEWLETCNRAFAS